VRPPALAALALCVVLAADAGRAQVPIVADLSDHLIAVTTGFTGAELLLFGAIEGEGDVALVVKGPATEVGIAKRERLAGVWVNGEETVFRDVPAFYFVATTPGTMTRAPASLLKRHAIGLAQVRFTPSEPDRPDLADFRAAMVRRMQAEGLFPRSVEPISVLGGKLFRATVRFPSNTPTGIYAVEVYFIRDGAVVSAQTTPLAVSKVGLGAEAYDFAHRYAPAYGAIAVLLAAAVGWLANLLFRKN